MSESKIKISVKGNPIYRTQQGKEYQGDEQDFDINLTLQQAETLFHSLETSIIYAQVHQQKESGNQALIVLENTMDKTRFSWRRFDLLKVFTEQEIQGMFRRGDIYEAKPNVFKLLDHKRGWVPILKQLAKFPADEGSKVNIL